MIELWNNLYKFHAKLTHKTESQRSAEEKSNQKSLLIESVRETEAEEEEVIGCEGWRIFLIFASPLQGIDINLIFR
jgi:hypothetical protein